MYSYITHISFIGASYECMNSGAAPSNGGNYSTNIPLECCIETQLYCECVYCTFDLSKLNVSNVQNMSKMFQYCNSVHYINMSTWDTSNVSNMYQMFSGCESLLELDFYNFNLGKLTDFGSFISNCYSLNFINMNCYMNPNTEYSNNSYNLKENGTIVLNENYTYNEYFLNDLTNYNWNILPSQLDYKLIIVENGLEVTEGSVLVNDEALTYNSESGKWEGVTLNVNDVNVIITYNDNEYDININSKYLFVGDNNSSYSGFNITIKCGISDYNEKIYFINSAYTKYIEIMLVDNKMESPNYYINNNNPTLHEIKIIFNLKNLTSLKGLFTSFIENEFSYYYTININEIIFSDNFITTNIVDISYLITNDCFVTINDNFDFKNVLNANYAFNNCHINISNLKLDDLINNGNYNNMLDYSHVIYDCENEYQKRIIDNSNVNELICNNINYQLIIVENGLEVTEGTVLCNNSELIYNNESGKWEGNIILDDFDININYNNSDYKISYYLDYLFIGGNNETYNKINIIETCNNSVNLFINEQYKYNVKFVLLDGKQIKTSSLEYKTCYNNNIKLYDNNSHKISLYFDTSNVTDMSDMFYECSNLTSIIFGDNFDTSNVTSMSEMFNGCNNLTSLNLSNFDTSKVTTMYSMFRNCSGLTSLDLSNFDTSNVTSMNAMFYYCDKLISLDLSSFDTSNVTNMNYMFYNCSGLTSLDLSSFDTSKVTDMNSMFDGCNGLTSITFGLYSDVSNVTSYSYMFDGLPSNGTLTYPCTYSDSWNKLLNSTYLPWTKTCQSSEISVKLKFIENGLEITEGNVVVNNATFTFNSEEQVWEGTYVAEQQIYSVSLNDVEVGSVNHKFNINYVFIGNNNGSYSGFTITETISANSTSASYRLFYNNVYYENYINHIQNMFIDGVETTISSAKTFNSVGEHTVQMIMDASNITSMSSMFYYCRSLTELDLSNFDTSNLTSMHSMFRLCTSLTSITFGNKFDTSNVTRMDYMFCNCSGLTSIDLSSFNTCKVITMSDMFSSCQSLTSIIFGDNFDTSNVIDMYCMFCGCYKLTSLDLSSFDTSNVTSMNGIFQHCYKLTSLDLTHFNTSKVTNMHYMFYDCTSLTSLDLSSFDTSKVYNMHYMFDYCYCLTSLDLSSFDTSNVTDMSYMFNN